jgi:hypothetical protein
MPPPPQSDPLEADSSTEVETTAVEHSALDDRSAKIPAAEQSDTPVSCEGPANMSVTSSSAVSSGVEDANESLPTTTPQPRAEKGSDNILDEVPAREEEVDKSMAQEVNTELIVQTDCGSTGVFPQIPTSIFTEHSQDPEDSEHTATVMLTPERSNETTADTASVGDGAEQPVPDADETVEPPSKHVAAQIRTVQEDPTRIKDAKSPSTDSGNNDAGNLPAARVGHREGINAESIEQNVNVLGDATKLGAAARSIPPHLRSDRSVPRQWDMPVVKVGNLKSQ